MLLKSWLSSLGCRIQPTPRRPRPRQAPRTAGFIAAEIQVLEARDLLSGVLTDTTPVTTIHAVEGISTGNVVLATFTDAIPAAGLTTILDVPGSKVNSTIVAAVSGSNFVGAYQDAGNIYHGFLYNGATYTTFDTPGGTLTQVVGMSGGNIVGDYSDNTEFGFLYNGSTFTTIAVPGSKSTRVAGVSGSIVVGTYTDANWHNHGFLYQGSTFTILDAPGASDTNVTGISGDSVVGSYSDAGGTTHGFVYSGAAFTILDPPGSQGTRVAGISGNNIAGTYEDADGSHGFLYNGSTYTVINAPGAINTYISGVSGATVVGTYDNVAPGTFIGFYDYSTFRYDGTTFTTKGPFIAEVYNPDTNLGTWYQPGPVLSDFTPSVNWGGTTIGTPTVSVQLVSRSATGSTWQVVGSATYAQSGDYTVATTVNDAIGNTIQTNQTGFRVADSSLTNTTPNATFNAIEGQNSGNSVLATFVDSDPSAAQSGFAASVNWGGAVVGTPAVSVELVSRSGTGSTWQVVGNATYAQEGTFTVEVSVTDAAGSAVETGNTVFHVSNAPLTDTTPVTTVNAVKGQSTGIVVLATFTDANSFASQSNFIPTVDWNGKLSGAPVLSVQLVSRSAAGSVWEVVGSATYAQTGDHAIAVTVGDATGSDVIQTSNTTISAADTLLIDTTPVTTVSVAPGTNTGDVVLATFTEAPHVIKIDPPGSIDSWVLGVDGNHVVGAYYDGNYVQHNFIFDGSNYTTFDVPGIGEPGIAGISGNTVYGWYFGNPQIFGFAYDGSTFTSISPPGATSGSVYVNGASGNFVVGTYSSTDGNEHGFIYQISTSTFTKLDFPGAGFTVPVGVSGSDVVGYYGDARGTGHRFVYDGANFTSIDVPWSNETSLIYASGGNVVGTYVGSDRLYHAFLYHGSTYSMLDIPGNSQLNIRGISGNSVIGINQDSDGDYHGISYDISTKSLHTIDVPWAINTFPVAVSGNNVAGTYGDGTESNGRLRGYGYLSVPDADPSQFTPTVNWGGTLIGAPTISVRLVSQSAAGSTWEVVGNATYAQAGNYAVSVTVNDASGNSVSASNTTISVAAAPDGQSAIIPEVNLQSSALATTFLLQDGTANGTVVHVKSITPGVLLGLDGPVQGMTGTRQNGKVYWTSTAGATLIFPDSYDPTQ